MNVEVEGEGEVKGERSDLTPIFELGVDEAYAILSGRFGQTNLPPLDAIENEDWGRDLLLSRFLTIPAEALAEARLTL